MPELSISPEKLAFIIEKAREFDVKEGSSDLDSGSNAASTGPTSASRRIPQARANEDELGVGRRLCSAAAAHSFTSHRTSPRCWSLLGTGKEI